MPESRVTLRSGFLRSSEAFPDRPALRVGNQELSYRELRERAAALAATLEGAAPDAEPPLTAVFGQRSAAVYTGVLAALFRGHGYVPLNPTFPTERTRSMLQRSQCATVIVDAVAEPQLDAVLAGLDGARVVVLPEREDVSALAARWPAHRFVGAGELRSAADWRPGPVDPDGIAYLLFTSGSTGIPKGVMVAHRNVTWFVDAMVERYAVSENDRFTQNFELTFDLSVFDLFVAWERGACVCVPSDKDRLLPARFLAACEPTIWFSVPSTGVLMKRLRMLKPDQYPCLRLSLFCGEALPAEVVQQWAEAAPRSQIENLYGPTELTIACTLYRWDPDTSPDECELGLVPIGEPYPGMEVLVADESLREVEPGETGELLMTGPQMTLGYWQDAEKTAAAFVVPPGREATYYRTGDRVRRPRDGRPLVYLGRVDNQIKIQGYRVELGEIEAVLRDEARCDTAIALGWPLTSSGADGVVAFLPAEIDDVELVLERAKARLPAYMLPRRILTVDEFPLNANGKVDRKALTELLEKTD
ncbi:MAG: amino acid adenylation domain-containing protein [Myxococcota bacterium]|nr:amino acid adenylation domain-containing protein [Myxococcota bacterium]